MDSGFSGAWGTTHICIELIPSEFDRHSRWTSETPNLQQLALRARYGMRGATTASFGPIGTLCSTALFLNVEEAIHSESNILHQNFHP